MRTHGWSGAAPASDEEAVARILAAASKAIDTNGADISIADVARTLGVTRQTVYRYFPSTHALLSAAAAEAATGYLDRLADHLAGITDPADAVVEGIANALEWIPNDKHMGLLLGPDRASAFSADVTSDIALDFARTMLGRFDVDWAGIGYTEADLDELAEHLLRIIQSFVIDPGRPPRRGVPLRQYLRRWVAPALSAVADESPRRSAKDADEPLARRAMDADERLARRAKDTVGS